MRHQPRVAGDARYMAHGRRNHITSVVRPRRPRVRAHPHRRKLAQRAAHEHIPEAVAVGWAEFHPFAGVRPGFEAFVMLFTLRSSEEVDVIFQFILEALNFISG